MVSSVNIDVLTVMLPTLNPVKLSVYLIALAKHLMHKINRVGERGPPCLTLLWT